MQAIWGWFAENFQWIFSGIGAILVGFLLKHIYTNFINKNQPDKGDKISTKGDHSPGKVLGDYHNVTIHEAPKPEPPKKS